MPQLIFSQQPFPCDGSFLLSVANHNRDASALYQGRLQANGEVDFQTLNLNNPRGHNLNALGFSMRDNLIYGFDPNTYSVFTIDANGTVETIREYPELAELGYEFSAGEMDRTGNRMIVLGRKGDPASDREALMIRLDRPDDTPGTILVQTDIPVRLDDFAFDPITGVVYGFDALNKRIVTVGLGTTFSVFTHEFATISGVGKLGSIFFDQEGNLYGYGSKSGETDTFLFLFDKNTGQMISSVAGPQSGFSTDGCGCPYTFRVEKDAQPRQAVGCSEVIITYSIVNESGAGRSGAHLRDSFPEGFLITEIEPNFFLATINSGEGTNVLDLTNISAPVGIYDLKVHVQVPPDFIGEVKTQATIDNLLLAFGESTVSDDPLLLGSADATSFQVVEPNSIELEAQLTQLCHDESATLFAPFEGESYLWSDGSTEPTLTVTESGTYWLEIQGDCFTYLDTIELAQAVEPLQLDLIAPAQIQSGDDLNFTYETTATGDLIYEWFTSSDEITLSCYDCPFPTAAPPSEANYTLKISDQYGCFVTDSVNVEVTKSDRFYYATAFSPNGDGQNDFFFIQGKVFANINTLKVFNRWGGLIYESNDGEVNDFQTGWDGNVNGQPAENGIYLWYAQVEFSDGSSEILSGELALMR
ncbi:MAG: gliding motility-associated C-terminal domain-containing protein [Saprospiraceae bacterium]